MFSGLLRALKASPLVLLLFVAGSTPAVTSCAAAMAGADCCRVCSRGKPCGDTCISRDKECHVGPGCAC